MDHLTKAEAHITTLAHSDDEALYDRAVDSQIAALAQVMTAPAPDLQAAAWKLDLFERHLVWELNFGEDALAVLRADLRRLGR
jgi:hypothetical protein